MSHRVFFFCNITRIKNINFCFIRFNNVQMVKITRKWDQLQLAYFPRELGTFLIVVGAVFFIKRNERG